MNAQTALLQIRIVGINVIKLQMYQFGCFSVCFSSNFPDMNNLMQNAIQNKYR